MRPSGARGSALDGTYWLTALLHNGHGHGHGHDGEALAAARQPSLKAERAGYMSLSQFVPAWLAPRGAAPVLEGRYPVTGVPARYAPASRSSMRVGPAGVQPRSSRVAVLVAARSMPKKVPIHPK